MTVPPWEQQGMSLAQVWAVFEFPEGVERGGLRRRWLARVVDLVVLAPLIGGAFILAGSDARTTTLRVIGTALLVAWGAYEVGMVMRFGGTLGKKLLGIRIAHMDDLANPRLSSAVLRWVFLAASILSFPRLLLTAFSPHNDGDGRQRSWADQVAGTVVIRSSPMSR
ncbi:MAG TPA: RDD family protein [Sporichthya sp.]|nr:RDD family protein [Sporichthya sp.]